MNKTTSDDTLEFDVGKGQQAVDVSIPEAEAPANAQQGAPAGASGPSAAAQSQEGSLAGELDTISDSVKRRIAKLTARMRESERQRDAAIALAHGLRSEATQLQQRLVQTDVGRMSEAKSRIDTQIATLKSIIERAREENDVDTETDAQQRLTQLTLEQQQVAAYLPPQQMVPQQMVPQQMVPQQMAPVQAQYQAPPPVRQAAPSPSDPKADAWAARNEWFGKDQAMTYTAFEIHKSLVDQEGFDPSSDEYYTELDRRIAGRFPDRAQSSQPRTQRHAPAVVPASRSSGVNSARKLVRLTPSEVAIANKLGVPLTEYAKYKKV